MSSGDTRPKRSMSSPFFYIIFSLMISSAALSVIFLLAWNSFGRRPHALTWSLGFFAGMLQWAVTLNAGLFPNAETFELVRNAFALTFVTVCLRGHCQRTQCKMLPANLFPYAAAVYAITAWYVIVDPHAGMRLALIPAYAALTLFLSAFVIITYRARVRPSERAAAIFITLFATSQAVAAWLAASQGRFPDDELFALYTHFTYLTLPAGYMAMSMFVILMLASDMSATLKQLAISDQLTGVLNRRGFVEYGKKAFAAARRNGTPLSLIMTDIDRFKRINDRYGHAAGDTALVHFARLMSESRRSEDVVARMGGEEFAILLPGTHLREAMTMADQLRRKIGNSPMDTTTVGLPMTSSFGVAAISDSDSDLDDIVRRADNALYQSKRAGRNQVDLESSQLMLAADGTLQPLS